MVLRPFCLPMNILSNNPLWFAIVTIALVVVGGEYGHARLQTNGGPDSGPLQDRLMAEPISELAADVTRLGNPERGAIVFFQPELNCARCHDHTASGRRLGPDLTQRRVATTEHLIESLLHPSRQIKKGYQSAIARTLDGQLFTGVFVGQNESELIIDQIEQVNEPLRLDRAQIEEWRKTDESSMPAALVNHLASRQQFLDLVSYLGEIAEHGPARASQLRPLESLLELPPLPEYESRIDHRNMIAGWNRQSFERGQEIYRLRCASCHGTIENEGSLPRSMRFAEQQFKHGKDPLSLYQTLTNGYGMMNPQRWMVPQQKYDVIHYLREHFLKKRNPGEYYPITGSYLNSLPTGDTMGPEPEEDQPWSRMNYGPVLQNTIEISDDRSNIAQKGMAIRLDAGPGGVESGKYWILYDHDTMRVAGAWTGRFIDFNGIHFNGVHGRHPRIAGPLLFSNPDGPGWGSPEDDSFEDRRLLGRDGRRYGPLPSDWLSYRGRYQYDRQCILRYRIGESDILETPRLEFVGNRPLIARYFDIEEGDADRVLQVARVGQPLIFESANQQTLGFGELPNRKAALPETVTVLDFDGRHYAELKNGRDLDTHHRDFTLCAEIRTDQDGTIFCKTRAQDQWTPGGTTLFIREGRLHYDIGWVGVVQSDQVVADGNWHRVVMTWQARSGQVAFHVDGQFAGGGEIRPKGSLKESVARLGFTNQDFPESSAFCGQMRNVRFYSRCLTEPELVGRSWPDDGMVAFWPMSAEQMWADRSGNANDVRWVPLASSDRSGQKSLVIHSTLPPEDFDWLISEDGDVRIRIAASAEPRVFAVLLLASDEDLDPQEMHKQLAVRPIDGLGLRPFVQGGPPRWPSLSSEVVWGKQQGPFQVDVFKRPGDPENDRLRLTGIDFLRDGRDAVVCCWDGTVWRISGIDEASNSNNHLVHWQRIASGLFQPLGIKVVDEKIFVSCRDQIVCLHDLNADGETDWYQNFNSDHQVTEHFHEFAMGLQTDDEGNFYYAKSARHALEAVVPQHGTLIRVAPDGSGSEIVAVGFRAANGVCVNPDGTFVVTDQEGHWNPKNRINWVRPGGFYGNMFGYHDVGDASDAAMEPPLCWITNHFDRSPAELLWVTSDRWRPLQGCLLNFSYGNGRIFIVPHENVDGIMQGGMCALPLKRFPTGIMRGRFNPLDGQLYCCGMFAWSGDQTQPGGLYRVRYTGQDVHLPIGIAASPGRLDIEFSGQLDERAVANAENYRIATWDLKRTKNYGSDHFNTKQLSVLKASLKQDGRTVSLSIPDLKATRGMEIKYSLRKGNGDNFRGTIHNTIHQLAK